MLPKIRLVIERWKYNKEYEVYVSTLGNFKNKKREELKPRISKGYCYIRTCKGYKSAHRLVLMTWKPNKFYEVLTVDHLNSNTRDNSLKNLEWVTNEENQARALKNNEENLARALRNNEVQNITFNITINRQRASSKEDLYTKVLEIYKDGYPKDIFLKKVNDLISGKNTAKMVKLGQSVILRKEEVLI